MYGRSTSVESCWHHYFKFSHVWTQFFARLRFTSPTRTETRDSSSPCRCADLVRTIGLSDEESTCSGAENDAPSASTAEQWETPRGSIRASHNVARVCMPEACGQCNLECYLCLRRVELGDPDDENPHCVLSRDKDTGEDIDTDIKTLCTDEGEKSGGPAQQDWQVISEANQSMTRTINCPRDSNDCDRAVLFETSHVEFDEFYFQVELDGEDRNHHEWLKGVSFTMRYRNADFSLYEIGFRYAFSIINLVVWLIFECSVCRRKQVAQGMGISLSNGRGVAALWIRRWVLRRRQLQYPYSACLHHRQDQDLPHAIFCAVAAAAADRAAPVQQPAVYFRVRGDGAALLRDPRDNFPGVLSRILMACLLAEFEQLADDRADIPNICEWTCASLFRNVMLVLFVLTSIPAYSYIKMQTGKSAL